MTTANRELAARLADLLRREHSALADFLLVLADFDRQRGWREMGYASLFDFLHRELGLSKGTAFYRKTAAELVQRYPEVIEPLRDGRLCITSIVELARVITPENRSQILPRFFHRSKQEAKAVSAEIAPREIAPRRDVVTTLPVPAALVLDRQMETRSHPVQPVEPDCPEGVKVEDAASPAEPVLLPEPPRATAEPLTGELRRLHVTVSKGFLDKLDAARAALSHALPCATTEAVLEAALDLVLATDAKKKAMVAKPRPAGPVPPPGARYVPAAVRRAVWSRDQGKCQWPLESGGVCGSTMQVELDHTDPIGRGGQSTIEGTRLLCKPHNDLAARLVYGDPWMDRFTGRGGRDGGRAGASAGRVAASGPSAPELPGLTPPG